MRQSQSRQQRRAVEPPRDLAGASKYPSGSTHACCFFTTIIPTGFENQNRFLGSPGETGSSTMLFVGFRHPSQYQQRKRTDSDGQNFFEYNFGPIRKKFVGQVAGQSAILSSGRAPSPQIAQPCMPVGTRQPLDAFLHAQLTSKVWSVILRLFDIK
jgi:hypothetical protein